MDKIDGACQTFGGAVHLYQEPGSESLGPGFFHARCAVEQLGQLAGPITRRSPVQIRPAPRPTQVTKSPRGVIAMLASLSAAGVAAAPVLLAALSGLIGILL